MSELFVEKQIESKYGTVHLAITHNDHISARITADFHGTIYNVHVHYYLIAGKWVFKDRDSISVRRAWDGNPKNYDKPAAPTHVNAITDELIAVLNSFVAANPGDLVEAQRRHLTDKVKCAYSKTQELELELAAAYAKHKALDK